MTDTIIDTCVKDGDMLDFFTDPMLPEHTGVCPTCGETYYNDV